MFGNITVIKNTLQLTYLEITTNTSSTEAAMSMFLKRRTEKTLNKAQWSNVAQLPAVEILFLTTTFLKLSQYFSEKGVGRAPHGSPLGTPMLLTGREQRGQSYRSGSLFTKSFRKFQLKSKWITCFRIVPVENFKGKQNIWKGVSDFLVGNTYSVYLFRKQAMQFLKVFLILDPDLLSFPMEFNTARKSEAKINGEGGIV